MISFSIQESGVQELQNGTADWTRLSGCWALCCCSSSCWRRFELEDEDDLRLDGTLVIWVAALEKLPVACARGATREAVSLAVSPEVREPLRLEGLLAIWVSALEKVSVTSPARVSASEALVLAIEPEDSEALRPDGLLAS